MRSTLSGQQLQAFLEEGITIATLEKIERFANAQRRALLVMESVQGKLALLSEEDSEVMAEAPPAETYGVNAMRQVMTVLGENLARSVAPAPPPRIPYLLDGPSVSELIHGLREAKEAGMEEVVALLQAKLRKRLEQEGEGSGVEVVEEGAVR